MADEKKLDLSALGLEQEATPAEQAASNAATQTTTETPVIHNEKIDTKVIKDPERGEVKIDIVKSDIDPNSIPRPKLKPPTLDKKGNELKVARPIRPTGDAGYNNDYQEITDINKIAKNPISKKKDPIRDTLNGLYGKADAGIERAKAEATKPGGRIDEAKHKYIDTQYALISKRAKNSKNLKKKIATINEIIDTDPRFDGITDYERKAYIVFKVAHDENVGINDESFGISDADVGTRFRNSAEASKAIEKQVSNDPDEIDDNKFVIGEDTSSSLPFKEDVEEKKEEVKAEDPPVIDLPKKEPVEKVVDEDDNDSLPVKEEEDEETDIDVNLDKSIKTQSVFASKPNTEPVAGSDDEEEEIVDTDDIEEETPEEARSRRKKNGEIFLEQIDTVLNLKGIDHALDDYEMGSPISLSMAIDHKKNVAPIPRVTWGLQYTGTSFDMTPYSGEELIQFQKEPKEFENLKNLRTIFTIMYNHYVVPKKPKFETWLKQISNYDIPCLMFGMYLACYSKSNYMPYECHNPKCGKIFLEKKEPLDMVIFPNEDSKKRFNSILQKDSVPTRLYRTKPTKINEKYSISFVTPSIWSATFEQAALSDEIKTKFQNLTNLMPYIDCIYLNDNVNKKLNRIMFGAIENDVPKTVLRKVKGLASIFKTFNSDELNRISFEIGKIAASLNEEQISYQIPATTCPDCHTEINRSERGPLELLFTRAQLLTMKAIIPELT